MKKLLLIPLVAAVLATSAHADNTANVQVPLSGEIIQALEVSLNNSGIVMPDMVAPASGEGDASVKLRCDSNGDATVSYPSGNSNPYAHGTAATTSVNLTSANKLGNLGNFTGTCADLAVTGEADYHYMVAVTPPGNISADFQATTVICNEDLFAGGVSYGTVGTEGLYCGAVVTAKNTLAGAPTSYDTSGNGDATVTITYD